MTKTKIGETEFDFSRRDKVWFIDTVRGYVQKAIVFNLWIDLFDIPRYQLKITSRKQNHPFRNGSIIVVNRSHVAERDPKSP